MNKNENILIIVESPNKVKTIEPILKKAGYTNAIVLASVGHIVQLGNGGPYYNTGIFPDDEFKLNLVISEEKRKVVTTITNQAKKADKIILMTDGDREGEIIAWSLIKFCTLPINKCARAITHEITPKAVINAIENPTTLNIDLVNAGLARMRVDKMIGWGLSPIVKRYIGAKSVGRCQSVGLKIVADREREIQNFKPEEYYELFLNFFKNGEINKAKYVLKKDEILTKDRINQISKECESSSYLVTNVETKLKKESPKPPFSTATFQQEASTRLNLSPKSSMSCAQRLFEGLDINNEHIGLITYHRTDSTDLAPEFVPELKAFICETFGEKSFTIPQNGKKGAQDGHEALRVVNPYMTPNKLAQYLKDEILLKVYSIIWQRTIAAAMPEAIYEETFYTITNSNNTFEFKTKRLTFVGFKLVYGKDIENNSKILQLNEELTKTQLVNELKMTQPKARFTEASLVKELQKREIGRPSTYATIVETITSPTRGYATIENRQIIPTERGSQLASYCDRAFEKIINLDYTKKLEESLDAIAKGNLNWLDYMNMFKADLDSTIATSKQSDELNNIENSEQVLCPLCGKPMVIRRSRYGKMFYGCSDYPKCRGLVNKD